MTEPKPAAPLLNEAASNPNATITGLLHRLEMLDDPELANYLLGWRALAEDACRLARAALAQPVTHDDLPRCPRCDSNKTVFHCEQCGENF